MGNPKAKNLAFIDIEATSADPEAADIIEIAFVIKSPQGELVDHFHSLVRPTRPVPEEITALTGITNSMVANAPEFHNIAETAREKLRNTKLVAHKARFDRDILKAKFAQLGMEFSPPCRCTLEMAKKTAPGISSYSLSGLCRFFGIPLKKNHRAMEDAEAAEKLHEILLLLSGGTERKRIRFLAPHQKMINRAKKAPGVVVYKNAKGEVLRKAAVENIQKELEDNLELTSSNKHLVSNCGDIQTMETGSFARAMILAAKNKEPRWSVYSFKNKRGQIVVKLGKVRKDKKALLYFYKKDEALAALKKIKSASKNAAASYAYRDAASPDKSEIVKQNAAVKERLKSMKPDLANTLIRSKTKVNGLYQYILIQENDRFALFEHEEKLEKIRNPLWPRVKLKQMRPSTKRALELSVQFSKNQKHKTDVVVKLKRPEGVKKPFENRNP